MADDKDYNLSGLNPLTAILKELHDGMLAEYDHGVDDGLKMALGGLTKVVDHHNLPDEMLSGLDMAISIVKALQEQLQVLRNAKPEEPTAMTETLNVHKENN